MQYLAADAALRARRVRLVIFDVDGVLTDGRLWYGPRGDVMKVFHAFDGHGIKLLQYAGLVTAILSGRRSPAVTARAKELGIKHVLQGIDDTLAAFQKLLRKIRIKADDAAYMGDDLVDLPVLERCGFACAPREAPRDVRARVHAVPTARAGFGAAREVCDYILQVRGK